MATYSFNAQNVAPAVPYQPLPAGNYIVQITDSEVKQTKAGTGRFLALKMEVLQGEFARRTLFANINVENPNSQAQEIGQAQLSALCHAAGVLQLQDTSQLHGRPISVKVAIRKGDNGDQNDVKGYESAAGFQPPPVGYAGQAGQGQPAQQPAPAAAAAPWTTAAR